MGLRNLAVVLSFGILFMAGMVLRDVEAQVPTCNNPTPSIRCGGSSYTVGCTNYTQAYPITTAFTAVVQEVAATLGCWCQNAGCGAVAGTPDCPAWLTCPPPIEALIAVGYYLEITVFRTSLCHCQCMAGECPGYTL